MSKLSEIFQSIKATLHWGPSVEPFHVAVVEEHDALEARVKALEDQAAADKPMMDMMRAEYKDFTTTRSSIESPQYITDHANDAQTAVHAALVGAPDDAASITEESRGAGANADSSLLAAPPEPVPAGPAEAIDALAEGDDAKPEDPAQAQVTE